MGCAYVKKIDIKTKDIDLSGEITKPHYNEANNNLIIAPKKESTDTINIAKFNFRNLEKPKKNSNENKKKENKKKISKSKSLNNMNEFKFSGPIISLLRNKVDNYQKKMLSNKNINCKFPKNCNKEY